MARTVLRRRRDGTYAIRRITSWRWAWVVSAGACVVLPLALSLVFLLPVILLALPPMALGVGTWILFRRLGVAATPRPPAPRGPGRLVAPPRAWPKVEPLPRRRARVLGFPRRNS